MNKFRGSRGSFAAVGNAVRDADGAEAAAGQEHSGNRRQALFDGRDARQVTDFILRTLPVKAVQPRHHRVTGYVEYAGQRVTGDLD